MPKYITIRFRIDNRCINDVDAIGQEADLTHKEVVRRCLIAVQPWAIEQVASAKQLDTKQNEKELEVNLHPKELELLQKLSNQLGYATCSYPTRLIRLYFLLGLHFIKVEPQYLWKVPELSQILFQKSKSL
jgi:hypothetical protein